MNLVRNEIERGQVIRRTRKAQGLTQAELARRAHVSRSFVIALEQGSKAGAELARVMHDLRVLEIAITLERDVTSFFALSADQLLENREP